MFPPFRVNVLMLDALKKILGLDEESKKAREKAAEEERREREERVAQAKQGLEKVAEAQKEDG